MSSLTFLLFENVEGDPESIRFVLYIYFDATVYRGPGVVRYSGCYLDILLHPGGFQVGQCTQVGWDDFQTNAVASFGEENTTSCMLSLKGAVSRDFLASFYVTNRSHLGP